MIYESKEDGNTFRAVTNMDSYNNSFEHLLEELSRIDLIVQRHLKKCRNSQHYADDLIGLYISEDEIDEILRSQQHGFKTDLNFDLELEEIKEIAIKINRKKDESIKRGTELRLQTLSELFHLNSFELEVILICLASELNLQYEKLYSYLQNDVTKKRPAVDLVMKLLCLSIEERFKARKYFSPDAPLIKNHLISLNGKDAQGQLPLLSKSIKLDERIINFLLGFDEIDPRLRNFSSIVVPKKSFNDLILAEDEKKTLVDIVSFNGQNKIPVMFLFYGSYGTGKKMAAEVISSELGTKMLVVDSNILLKSEPF